jgi:hypothetical protein
VKNRNFFVVTNAVFVTAAIFASASYAQAGFILIIQQVGSNVVATGSGTINLSALTSNSSEREYAQIISASGIFFDGSPAISTFDVYTGLSGPSAFGSGGYYGANSGSGDSVGISEGTSIFVPTGYVSGAALSDTSTYTNKTLAALHLTTGTYTWTWGTGATADTFELDIGPASTPEPSTFALLALAASGLMLGFCFRRVPVVKMDAVCSSSSGRISPTEVL